ncbi:MAG: sugar phosphate isomerase/epimerase [Oscillospiraceae bacterium]|nr:sugar phosphate isomerase/epimerase [Oscillospiraceae bacterium]
MLNAGVETIQLSVWPRAAQYMDDAHIDEMKRYLNGRARITSVWGGWSEPAVWDFWKGPSTLGLVPAQYRVQRVAELKKSADLAYKLGVHDLATHVGFIPEQPCYDGYQELVETIADLADYCAERDLSFNFETGQETPVTLMRVIHDTGKKNLGVNLDPANLILYGRANPVDAIDIYGDRIRGVHIKDGTYPCGDFRNLGEERVVGEGSVNFPVFLPKLLAQGYTGDLYIEREIDGDEQMTDVIKTISYLRDLMR